jgi:hypothetical protein
MSSQLHVLGHVTFTSSYYTGVGFKVVLAIHIMAVVVAFGATFAYPIIFAVGARQEPRSLPLLHRIEYNVERWLLNPALVVVLGAGIYLASDAHLWKEFFVQWGFAAVIVIGGLVGAVMIPTSKRAEEVARRDIEASTSAAETGTSPAQAGALATETGTADAQMTRHGTIAFSAEYQGLVRRLTIVGSSLSLLVLVTIFFMAYKL